MQVFSVRCIGDGPETPIGIEVFSGCVRRDHFIQRTGKSQ